MSNFKRNLEQYLYEIIDNEFPNVVRPFPDFDNPETNTKTRNIIDFENTYNLLSDEYSKDLFIKLIYYRKFGPSKVKLPLHDKALWAPMFDIWNKCARVETHQTKSWNLNSFDLIPIGKNIRYFSLIESVFIALGLNEYGYNKNDVNFKVEKGDYVIEGGACFGESTLHFAEDVGKTGKVFTFEFVEDNLNVFHKNLELNPHLNKRIQLFENALWSNSSENLFIIEKGAASQVTMQEPSVYSQKTPSKSIDDLVKEQNIHKVDFIKLDIEGAELECLHGARETILNFKPKLAICLYHDVEHFISIPQYVKELVPEYDLYINHHTACHWETVMYAMPKRNM